MAKNYFLPYHEEFQRRHLSHVVHAPFSLDGYEGAIVDGEMLCLLLGTGRFEAEAESRTKVSGLVRVVVRCRMESDDPPTVMVTYLDGPPDPQMISVVAEYLGVIEKPIHIHAASNKVQESIDDGNLHIWLYARHPGNGSNGLKVRSPKMMFGIEYRMGEYCFRPSLIGRGIITDEESFVAGEIVGNNLYVHFYPPNSESPTTQWELFRDFLDATQVILVGPEQHEMFRELRHRGSRSRYVDLCSDVLRDELKQSELKTERLSETIRSLQRDLEYQIRELRRAQEAIETQKVQIKTADEKFSVDFDLIKKLDHVRQFEVRKERLIVVHTDTLCCVDPRTGINHEIGRFRIHIRLGEKYGIRWFNLSRAIDGYYAPHVRIDGSACMGNFDQMLPELVAENQVNVLIQLAIRFIQSVNTDDAWGMRIANWPRAKRRLINVV